MKRKFDKIDYLFWFSTGAYLVLALTDWNEGFEVAAFMLMTIFFIISETADTVIERAEIKIATDYMAY